MRSLLGQLRGGPGIEIDPDYSNRKGYDEHFLDTPVPLPILPDELAAQAALNT